MSKRSKNRIEIEGRMARDAERLGKITKLRVGVDSWRKKKDARPEDRNQNETNWFTVVCFSAHADAAMGLRKGQLIRAVGSLEFCPWKDRNGVEREGAEVQVGRDGWVGLAEDAPGANEEPPSERPAPRQDRRAASAGDEFFRDPPEQAAPPDYNDSDVPF